MKEKLSMKPSVERPEANVGMEWWEETASEDRKGSILFGVGHEGGVGYLGCSP